MEYEKIPYSSFMWKLGTTSFRTKEFNFKTEMQLALLDDFWKIPEKPIKVGRRNIWLLVKKISMKSK